VTDDEAATWRIIVEAENRYVLALLDTREELKEALEHIASLRSYESQGHTSRAGRFRECQRIASEVLSRLRGET
jgi:hypothetical protein